MPDDAKNIIVIFGIIKEYTDDVLLSYSFLVGAYNQPIMVGPLSIISRVGEGYAWEPASIDSTTDIGQKVAQNADKIVADIESYLEKHTENVII